MALWRSGGDPGAATRGLDDLGFDSCGLYNPLLSVNAPQGPPRYAELAHLASTVLQPALQETSPIPFFPAASLGWQLGDESFMQWVPAMSDLKLRLSYGRVGNSAIGAYQTLGSKTKTPGSSNTSAPWA